jgi:hypothetical protein
LRHFIYVSLVCFVAISLSACSSIYNASSKNVTISKVAELASELEETSGLYCSTDTLLSINDSGNAPVVFTLNYEGNIVDRTQLAVTNKDWEAVTADERALYVADVGNNKGKRDVVEIYKIQRDNVNSIKTLNIQYEGNDVTSNIPYAHDFDAEAMIKTDSGLLLFSKSWRSFVTNIYKVDETRTQQTLSAFATIEGLPGVVTGADFDSTRNQYVVVGYRSDPFGNFAAFLATTSAGFDVLNLWPLEDYKQVEGVCVDAKGSYWFSEEAIDSRPASLSKFVIN